VGTFVAKKTLILY